MKIRRIETKIHEDNNIDSIIREYGIRRTAREIGISASNLSMYLKGDVPMPEKVYQSIIKHFKLI